MTQILIALAVAAACFGGGWQVRAWKADADDKARLEKMVEDYHSAVKDGAEASEKLEKSLGKIKPVYRTINNEVQRTVVREPVYTDCIVTADGVQLVNRAVQAANNPGEPDLPVPVTVIPPRQVEHGGSPKP